MVQKAKSEWIFDTSYKAWFYIKADGRYAQKEWHGNYYLKAGGYMAKMNGFTITIIRAGSTSKQMVLMQNKNGMETTTSKWVATWLRVNGFTITIIRVGFT